VGALVGRIVGDVGALVGFRLGAQLGDNDGDEGGSVGKHEGSSVGHCEGSSVGEVGYMTAVGVREMVGAIVGDVGARDGRTLGLSQQLIKSVRGVEYKEQKLSLSVWNTHLEGATLTVGAIVVGAQEGANVDGLIESSN